MLAGCFAAYAQIIELGDGTTVDVTIDFRAPAGLAPQEVTLVSDASLPGLPFFPAFYDAFGTPLRFNIIGTDPALGAATTVVPAVIVPLQFVFPNGGVTLDGTNVVGTDVNSPIFQVADYTTGGTDLGVTQYGDAIQRAQFWNVPGFSQDGYHVLLAPAIAPTITVNVPVGSGAAYRQAGGNWLGVVDSTYFESLVRGLALLNPATQVTIFVTDNVFEGAGGLIQNCCNLGYHTSQIAPVATARTWIYAAYVEPGTILARDVEGVQTLSHEVAEWLNDPFINNRIPPAVYPGRSTCLLEAEVGDPLAVPPVTFPVTIGSTTYRLQDEVFLPWYLHGPSFSVNGNYTFLGTYSQPSQLCGPG
jgi:hypothetical protein